MQTKFLFKGLTFEYIKNEYLSNIVKMLAKESVCEHVFFGPNSEEDTVGYFQPYIDSINKSICENKIPNDHIFVIRDKETFLGECALLPIMFTENNYLIGYQLDDTFWNKGYGTTACEFLVDFAFTHLNAERISGDCMTANAGSRKIMEKSGFKYEGCQRKYWKKNGKYSDNILFGILREDWATKEL